MPTFADISIKAQQKTYILREGAREAQSELLKQEAKAKEQIEKELPVRLRDLQRYVKSVDLLRQTLEKGEVKTLLLLMNGANKSRIFSTNFAIGFFRGAGAMLGVLVVAALLTLVVFNSPYSEVVVNLFNNGS